MQHEQRPGRWPRSGSRWPTVPGFSRGGRRRAGRDPLRSESRRRDGRGHRALVGVFLLGAVSGCLNLGVGLSPSVGSLQQSVVSEGDALPEFARASGGRGSVFVSGQIVGRLRCDYLVSNLEQFPGGLELTVTIVSGRQGCNSRTPSTLSYVGSIYSIDPGPVEIVVNHRYEGVDGPEGPRLSAVVTVN